MCGCMCMCVRVCMCMCACVCVHVYVCVCAHYSSASYMYGAHNLQRYAHFTVSTYIEEEKNGHSSLLLINIYAETVKCAYLCK